MSIRNFSNSTWSGLEITTIRRDDPNHMSDQNQKDLYQLIEDNKDKEDFIIHGQKPYAKILLGGCFCDFQYDVILHGNVLCKIYESDYYASNEPHSYIIEFQGQHYDSHQLFNGQQICTIVRNRWLADEERRKQDLHKQTVLENTAFLGTFTNKKTM